MDNDNIFTSDNSDKDISKNKLKELGAITKMKEIWKDIKGYKGLYQVSNKGNVKSLNYNRTGEEKIKKPKVNRNGYLRVKLHRDGNCKTLLIHRLVLMTFNPIDNMDKFEVNHKDENKQNNCLSNLE